jgi:hypothetical protein
MNNSPTQPSASASQEEKLMNLHQNIKMKDIKYQMMLVNVLNILTLFTLIFAMAFY